MLNWNIKKFREISKIEPRQDQMERESYNT